MLPENALQILQVAIALRTTMLTGTDRKTAALLDAMERHIDYKGGIYLINKNLRDTRAHAWYLELDGPLL